MIQKGVMICLGKGGLHSPSALSSTKSVVIESLWNVGSRKPLFGSRFTGLVCSEMYYLEAFTLHK